MATATSTGRTSWILVIVLLVLAGMVSGAGPAWAQLDCPLPDGVTPPAAPVLPGGPVDPSPMVLVGLALAYVTLGRRRPMRQAAMG